MPKYIFFFASILLIPLFADKNLFFYKKNINCRDYCTLPSLREERELFSKINSESRRLYNSLDCMGKNKALEFSQIFEDKNEAVQEAAKEMAKRQKTQYPNQKDYQREAEESVQDNLYNEKYGN